MRAFPRSPCRDAWARTRASQRSRSAMRPRPLPPIIAAALLLCSFNASAIPAPSYQPGGKLVGTGAVGAAHQAYSVALSADGNTAVVGGPGDNGNVGAARGCAGWGRGGGLRGGQ